MTRHVRGRPLSTSIFDQLAQSQADRFRVPDSAVPPLMISQEEDQLHEQHLRVHQQWQSEIWRRITRPETAEFVAWLQREGEAISRLTNVAGGTPSPSGREDDWWSAAPRWRPASRVQEGSTESATSSGPIEHSTSALDAAMVAAQRLRPRLTHSGVDPLAEWSKMRTAETTPPTSPTSTDSPAESP